jgi:hypothetical protein
MNVFYTPDNNYTRSVIKHLEYRYALDRYNESYEDNSTIPVELRRPVEIQFHGCDSESDVLTNASAKFEEAKDFCKKLNDENDGKFTARACFVPVLGE